VSTAIERWPRTPKVKPLSFFRPEDRRENTQNPTFPQTPRIRYLRKTRRLAVLPNFTEVSKGSDPIEPIRIEGRNGIVSAHGNSEANQTTATGRGKECERTRVFGVNCWFWQR
jgi:hypothetical protein